jgi:hypothetical protein
MKIVRLSAGEAKPDDADYVELVARPDGSYSYSGRAGVSAAKHGKGPVDGLAAGGASYPTIGEAEKKAFGWARLYPVDTLYVISPPA